MSNFEIYVYLFFIIQHAQIYFLRNNFSTFLFSKGHAPNQYGIFPIKQKESGLMRKINKKIGIYVQNTVLLRELPNLDGKHLIFVTKKRKNGQQAWVKPTMIRPKPQISIAGGERPADSE